MLILSLMPLIGVIALLVKLTDGAQVLFRHRRIGYSGRPFACLKFRSMRSDAGTALTEILAADPSAMSEWLSTRKLRDDPRVTRVGRFIRHFSLDELPQLINVVRGEMSLVGPRPIVTDEVHYYGHDFEQYTSARPGITGLWQISGRSDVDFPTRVRLDVDYVQNWTMRRDLLILLRTIGTVCRRTGSY
jgi:exopolysaccharide production protein ExoY